MIVLILALINCYSFITSQKLRKKQCSSSIKSYGGGGEQSEEVSSRRSVVPLALGVLGPVDWHLAISRPEWREIG